MLPEAHAGLAIALIIGLPDLRASEMALRRALALGGSPTVREHLSRVLTWSGRHAEALTEASRAAEEDPLSASAAADLGGALCANGRTDEGLSQLKRISAVRPPLRRVAGYRGLCYAMKGMWPEAVAEFSGGKEGAADSFSPMRGYALARAGEVAEAKRLQARVIEHWRRTGRGAHWIVYIAAGLGDYDLAFEWIDRSGDDLSGVSSLMYPMFGALQADPRFERLRARLGLEKR
jgi:tetratricopeptide (TPR) repeat protein